MRVIHCSFHAVTLPPDGPPALGPGHFLAEGQVPLLLAVRSGRFSILDTLAHLPGLAL